MPKPRYRQVSVDETPYYHCISRCVRRAFLCGRDAHTGYNFDHRRQWIIDRIRLICSVFAVDLYAYAVMSNHYHVVVRINAEQVKSWSDEDIARRWMKVFTGPLVMRHYLSNTDLNSTDRERVVELLATWRERLSNLSWFMRCINEPIARMANVEDHCTGSFWEGRFKSQALLDERALVACMVYVDLNPVRAAMAETPEESDYTSIQERIRQPDTDSLSILDENENENEKDKFPITLKDYLELVDWGGREIKHNKRGYIPNHAPPILARLHMDASPVLNYLSRDDVPGFGALGSVSRLKAFAKSIGRKFIKGHAAGNRLCPEHV